MADLHPAGWSDGRGVPRKRRTEGAGRRGQEKDFQREDRTAGLRTDRKLPATVQNEGPAPASRGDDTCACSWCARRQELCGTARRPPSLCGAPPRLFRHKFPSGAEPAAVRYEAPLGELTRLRLADPSPHCSPPSPPGRHRRLLVPVSSVPTQSTSPPASSRQLSVTDSSRRHLVS